MSRYNGWFVSSGRMFIVEYPNIFQKGETYFHNYNLPVKAIDLNQNEEYQCYVEKSLIEQLEAIKL